MDRSFARRRRSALRLCALAVAGLLPAGALEAQEKKPGERAGVTRLDEVVVTAPGRSEPLSQTASTIQVISEEKIRNSNARSVTDLLAENAVGFMSEWTPGQTLLNLRGGATEGQGRDFRSEVQILLNGRRAGTANISKLSLADVLRIEIIRGPASVVYGSQAIGGTVNIITRNSQNTEGRYISGISGSWGLVQGNAYAADKLGPGGYYVGLSGGRRDSYEAGQGAPEQPLANTAWNRQGALVSTGYDFDERNHFEVTARHDGTYDTGFRGSQWSYTSLEDRYNQSVDAIYTGRSIDNAYSWTAQTYFFNDVDDLNWTAFRQRTGAAGNSIDHNRRTQQAAGMKLVPEFRLSERNLLLTGVDVEQARLNSQRFIRAVAGPTTQLAPLDNNELDTTVGIYAEDVQHLLDDRLVLRGGVRYTYGNQELLTTPNQPLLRTGSRDYDNTTYSAGAAFLAADWLKLRTGTATGFRAPTGSELAASFISLGGAQTIGNPALKPESNIQYEVGATLTQRAALLDVALFQNKIYDRIIQRQLSSVGANTVSQFVNAPGEVLVRGVEMQGELDVAQLVGWSSIVRLFGNGVYNFDMQDHGADPRLIPKGRGNQVQRMYQYQLAVGGVLGESGKFDVRPLGILRGTMYYNTEEDLLTTYKPNAQYVSQKDPFWIWNLRGNYYPFDGVTVFATINNIFDANKSPQFISIDALPYQANPRGSNGGLGNSMPGREFLVGFQVFF